MTNNTDWEITNNIKVTNVQGTETRKTGTLAIGNGTLTITLTKFGTFWLVSGEASNISFNDLQSWVHDKFGVTIPQELTRLTLRKLNIQTSYSGTTKQKDVDVVVVMPLDVEDTQTELAVGLRFGVGTTGKPGRPPRNFFASASWTLIEMDGNTEIQRVTLGDGSIEFTQKDGLTLTASWTAAPDDDGLAITDIVKIFGLTWDDTTTPAAPKLKQIGGTYSFRTNSFAIGAKIDKLTVTLASIPATPIST